MRKPDLEGLGHRLEIELNVQRRTQVDVAKQAGITPQMLWNYINNRRTPELANAARLADALDVDLEWLVFGNNK